MTPPHLSGTLVGLAALGFSVPVYEANPPGASPTNGIAIHSAPPAPAAGKPKPKPQLVAHPVGSHLVGRPQRLPVASKR